jgi:hypothetical protein
MAANSIACLDQTNTRNRRASVYQIALTRERRQRI